MKKAKVNLPNRELYQVGETMCGEFHDVKVLTNGGVTHYVVNENVWDGGVTAFMFRSRAKALDWAAKRFENLNGVPA